MLINLLTQSKKNYSAESLRVKNIFPRKSRRFKSNPTAFATLKQLTFYTLNKQNQVLQITSRGWKMGTDKDYENEENCNEKN